MSDLTSFAMRMMNATELSDLGIVAEPKGKAGKFSDLTSLVSGVSDLDSVLVAATKLGADIKRSEDIAGSAKIKALVGAAMMIRRAKLNISVGDKSRTELAAKIARAISPKLADKGPSLNGAVSRLRQAEAQAPMLLDLANAVAERYDGYNGDKVPFENAFYKAVKNLADNKGVLPTAEQLGAAIAKPVPDAATEAAKKAAKAAKAGATPAEPAKVLDLNDVIEQAAKEIAQFTVNMPDKAAVNGALESLKRQVIEAMKQLKNKTATTAKEAGATVGKPDAK